MGRPQGHPIHAMYAKSVNSTFIHDDKKRLSEKSREIVSKYTEENARNVFLEEFDKALTDLNVLR